jgi:hypothetical protein
VATRLAPHVPAHAEPAYVRRDQRTALDDRGRSPVLSALPAHRAVVPPQSRRRLRDTARRFRNLSHPRRLQRRRQRFLVDEPTAGFLRRVRRRHVRSVGAAGAAGTRAVASASSNDRIRHDVRARAHRSRLRRSRPPQRLSLRHRAALHCAGTADVLRRRTLAHDRRIARARVPLGRFLQPLPLAPRNNGVGARAGLTAAVDDRARAAPRPRTRSADHLSLRTSDPAGRRRSNPRRSGRRGVALAPLVRGRLDRGAREVRGVVAQVQAHRVGKRELAEVGRRDQLAFDQRIRLG